MNNENKISYKKKLITWMFSGTEPLGGRYISCSKIVLPLVGVFDNSNFNFALQKLTFIDQKTFNSHKYFSTKIL